MNTARRRRDARRMLRKARSVYEGCEMPGLYANNLAVCSCPMCGNPRKWFKRKTRAERRFGLTFLEVVL